MSLTNYVTWTQGRRLSSITKGNQTYSYEYDMSGVRSVKVAEGMRHEYVTQNGKVVRDQVTDAATGAFQYMLDFTYDESGHPLTMRRYFNEAQSNYCTYHYILNAQGDVIKLMYGTNKTVAEYSYDAWGNLLNISGADLSVAKLNPLRYRGYYCDPETGFYYLQSRYYDPIVRRFLNADSYGSTGQGILGYNMFAYCNNDPVISADPAGHMCILFDDWMYGGAGDMECAGGCNVGGGSMIGAGLAAGGAAVAIAGAASGGGSLANGLADAATKLATTIADAVFGGSSSAATNQKKDASSGSKNKVKSATVSTPASPPNPNGNGENDEYTCFVCFIFQRDRCSVCGFCSESARFAYAR